VGHHVFPHPFLKAVLAVVIEQDELDARVIGIVSDVLRQGLNQIVQPAHACCAERNAILALHPAGELSVPNIHRFAMHDHWTKARKRLATASEVNCCAERFAFSRMAASSAGFLTSLPQPSRNSSTVLHRYPVLP